MATREQVVPQPPQVRPVGPAHDGFAPNDSIMTPDKVASIQERQYPKMMYCDGEEPLLVKTPEVEQTLGSGWRETPDDPNKSVAPLAVPETREDYYKLNQADVLAIIAQTTDSVVLRRMWTSEVANPRRPNGRPEVLEALTAALTPLEPVDPQTPAGTGDAQAAPPQAPAAVVPPHPPPAAPAAADLGPEGPPVATAPPVDGVNEAELEPLPPDAKPEKQKPTRGNRRS